MSLLHIHYHVISILLRKCDASSVLAVEIDEADET